MVGCYRSPLHRDRCFSVLQLSLAISLVLVSFVGATETGAGQTAPTTTGDPQPQQSTTNNGAAQAPVVVIPKAPTVAAKVQFNQNADLQGAAQAPVVVVDKISSATAKAQPLVFSHDAELEEEAESESMEQLTPQEHERHKQLLDKITDNTGHNGKHMEVSMQCLDCLCIFATNCDLERKCDVPFLTKGLEKGMDKGDCGPFHISFPFYADAFNLHVKEGGDAEMENNWKICSTNLVCSTESIQRYFQKYPHDCNKDGKIDCMDYAAIHTLGPFGCQDEKKLARWNKKRRESLLKCMASSKPGPYIQKMQEIQGVGKDHGEVTLQ